MNRDYRRNLRREMRATRRRRRRYEGGWLYRLLWPDPVLAIGCWLLIALVAVLASLLLYGQVTHDGDPLWWARCEGYARCNR